MKSKKENILLIFDQHFIVRGERKIVAMDKISRASTGNNHRETIYPASVCLVKNNGDKYTVLNLGDQRLCDFLNEYDNQTNIEVVVIADKDCERVAFIAGKLIPQKTSNIKFSNFLKEVVWNTKYQEWINENFTKKTSKINAKVIFDLIAFLKKMGSNAPSKATASKILRETKIDGPEIPTIKAPLKDEEQIPEPTIKEEIESLIIHPKEPLTDKQMKDKWEAHAGEKYRYQYKAVREFLPEKYNRTLTERLDLDSYSQEFKDFIKKLIRFLDEHFSK